MPSSVLNAGPDLSLGTEIFRNIHEPTGARLIVEVVVYGCALAHVFDLDLPD
jgi:hypothetical protein